MIHKSHKSGFTLIELLIVIIILGVLAALISGNFLSSLAKGRDAKRKGDLVQVQRALEMYYEDKRTYPTTGNIFNAAIYTANKLCETPTCVAGERVYMEKIPQDPIASRAYEYTFDSATQSYKLYACLENSQQVLPYQISGSSLSCPTTCFYPDTTSPKVPCIWGVTSSNTSP